LSHYAVFNLQPEINFYGSVRKLADAPSADQTESKPVKITNIKTYLVGNPWKNWLFVRVETDDGIHGIGEGSLGHLSRTVEAAIHEMKPFVLGLDAFQTEMVVLRLGRNVFADGGQIKMCAISAIEIAWWDIIGKALGQPIYNLLGGLCRDTIPPTLTGGTAAGARRKISRTRPKR
jgi:galactonate dehydratase